MLQRTKSKKGFTLAELLIVVAIIAVLTAIAVPLFIGALDKADESVLAANERAVRGEAVEKILTDERTSDGFLYKNAKKETYLSWLVTAIVSSSGEIKAMEITPSETADGAKVTTPSQKDATGKTVDTVEGTDSDYYIAIVLKDITPKLGS